MANNKLITPDFRLHQIRQFVESITEPANTIYYVFAGKPTEYITGDSNIDAPNNDVESLTTLVYDEMAFAKQVTANDVKALVKRHDWTTGTVYDMYDSLSAEGKQLKDKAFFVVSKEGGYFYVFKCLYNKEGANSTSQPLFSSTSADDTYYETADGYVWKYMYKIDETTFYKFSTIDYIPVIPDANVSANAINGQIDVIKIVSGGRDYNNFLSGSFTASDVRFGGVSTQYRITSANAASNTDFYEGCVLKIITGDGAGQYRKITSYSQISGYNVVNIDEPFLTTPSVSTFEISPEIIITGDGRQTINAEARALINTNSSNSIYKIEILNKGKDYRLASANTYINPIAKISNSTNQADLRVIYSPKGGHGYDAESELYATTMGISVKFSNNENGQISTDNDFRRIGLLKDPLFNDVKLTYDVSSFSGSFADTEEIIQAKLNRINGTVTINSNTKNIFSIGTLNTIQINSAGNVFFSNSDILTVSNVVVNAYANVVTNSAGYILASPLTSPGYGISDGSSPVITVANSTGGNTRYVNSKIITGLTATANGRAYTNSDYIIISSTSATVNAEASITTNSIGGITSVLITNSGKAFQNNEIGIIRIVNGGLGYSNSPISFTGGGGTGAVANAVTDVSGNVVSIVFYNRGTNYTSAPTVTIPGNGQSIGTFTPVLRTKNLSIKIANSSGGYSNGAKVISVFASGDEIPTTSNATLDLDFANSSYSLWESESFVSGDANLYANSDLLIIVSPSNTHGNAIANVVTYVDGSLKFVNVNAGNNFGFNLSNNNLDYYVVNSTGGYIRRFESKIVSSITVSNSSPSYKVSSVSITANGSGYNSTKVLRVNVIDGGIGYDSTANNRVIFTPTSGGTLANATFANDSTGKIISVTMVTAGNGYVTAPTVSLNAQSNGIGANLVAVLANSITFTSNIGGHGAIAYFGNNSTGNIVSVVVANAGFGYTTAPTATISDANGIGATFTVVTNGGANCFLTNDLIVVSGGTANAQGNATANATFFLSSISITDSGKGFNLSNAEMKITNSTGGNTRYVGMGISNAIIKEVSVTSGGFEQFAVNTDVVYITNGSITAVGNLVTNSVGGVTTINITSSGRGFVNASSINMFAVNSVGGDLRYFNTNVVSSISISDGGSGFNNTDFITITSPDGEIAYANLETTVNGTIVSTKLSNRGRRMVPSYVSGIEIVSGGAGYSNSDIIEFCGGGGTGANAVLLTNTSGGIVRAYIRSGGQNYDCAPTIEIANSSGGNANGVGANLVATVIKPSRLRIYNAFNNPSSGQFADLSFTIKTSPTLVANLIYAPIVGNTVESIKLSVPATILPIIDDSCNLYFTATQSANISLLLADNRTTFDSSISSGDKIYLQTISESQVMTVDQVVNSTYLTVTENPAFTNDQVAISIAKINARGYVKDRSAGYVKVTNAYGFFVQSNDMIGVTSRSYANVTSVTYNGISKTATNVDQLLTYYVSSGDNPISFEEEEIVRGGTSNLVTAYIHSANSTAIKVTNPSGIFYPGNTIVGETSGTTVVLDSSDAYKYEGDFVRGSGDVIYIESIDPVSRGNAQSETIKLILEF